MRGQQPFANRAFANHIGGGFTRGANGGIGWFGRLCSALLDGAAIRLAARDDAIWELHRPTN